MMNQPPQRSDMDDSYPLMYARMRAEQRDSGAAQAEREPVAYRWRIKDANGNVSGWEYSQYDPKISKFVLHDCEPLYTGPVSSTDRETP